MEVRKAQRIARQLMDAHGLELPYWKFEWDYAQQRFGVCRARFNTFYGEVSGTISMSIPLTRLNTEERFRATLLHEIAHALVAVKYKKGGHGHEWKRQARALGIAPERCYDVADTKTPAARYIATCQVGHTYERFKLSRRAQSCGHCAPRRYDPRYKLEWKRNPRFKKYG